MFLKHWGARLALVALLFAGALACRTADVFLAQAPTTTPTRTPRPTFTPLPPPTDTPAPTATTPPEPTAAPTKRPTARPLPRPTLRPPTPVPPPPAAPTTPPYQFTSANKNCFHSAQTFIQGTIYDKSGNHVNGVTIALSGGGPDGPIATTRHSGDDGDGFYSIIVNAYGASPGQSRWVWVVDSSNKRISDVVQFTFNNLPDSDPASCWRGTVDFVQQY